MGKMRESFLIVLSGFIGAIAKSYYEKYFGEPLTMFLLILSLLIMVILSISIFDKFFQKR